MPTITRCRSCLGERLESVLDLGTTPLANALLTEEQLSQPEARYPLHLVRCPDCALLQITENVPADLLFGTYFYRSSFSDAFLDHCRTLANRMVDDQSLGGDSLVVDIASNDGYLLQYYRERGVPTLGVEPAANIVEVAREKGIETVHDFFTLPLAERLAGEGKRADVIHAHNVMPHVADQRDFAAGIAALLKPDGIAVVEFAYAIDTVDHTEFDQIYHEHMCYFSLTSFTRLCSQFGLAAVRVERLPVHGGSLRVFLAHEGRVLQDETVPALLTGEERWGVEDPAVYRRFAERTHALKAELVGLLTDLKSQGKRIAVYGASAKGATLMNFMGIGRDLVDFIVDRSTLKQGTYAPGTHLLIRPVEALLEERPEYVLLLTWNFAAEILAQQAAYREGGGKFILPVPRVEIV